MYVLYGGFNLIFKSNIDEMIACSQFNRIFLF